MSPLLPHAYIAVSPDFCLFSFHSIAPIRALFLLLASSRLNPEQHLNPFLKTGIGMFTVLKNLANVFTIIGDYFIHGRTYGFNIWLCLALMIASAVAGGYTDASFSAAGYAWQLANCVLTSAYSLYLSGVMEKVTAHTSDRRRLNEFSMVYYNNLLSLAPTLVLMVAFGEPQRLPSQPALRDPEFLLVALMGGFFGFAISFSSLWYLSRTSATLFGLTGSLNKILVAVIGIVAFHEPTTARNLSSIGLGLLAGLAFGLAKQQGGGGVGGGGGGGGSAAGGK